MGIRKIALILGASSTAVLKWIRNAHKLLQELLENFNPLASEKLDTFPFPTRLNGFRKVKTACLRRLIHVKNTPSYNYIVYKKIGNVIVFVSFLS